MTKKQARRGLRDTSLSAIGSLLAMLLVWKITTLMETAFNRQNVDLSGVRLIGCGASFLMFLIFSGFAVHYFKKFVEAWN